MAGAAVGCSARRARTGGAAVPLLNAGCGPVLRPARGCGSGEPPRLPGQAVLPAAASRLVPVLAALARLLRLTRPVLRARLLRLAGTVLLAGLLRLPGRFG